MQKTDNKRNRRHVYVLAMDGSKNRVSVGRFSQVTNSTQFLIVSLVFVALVVVASPLIYGHQVDIIFRVLFWVGLLLLYVGLWLLIYYFLSVPKPAWFPRVIPTALIHVIVLGVVTYLTVALSSVWHSETHPVLVPSILDLGRLYVLVVIFELMVMFMVLPYLERKSIVATPGIQRDAGGNRTTMIISGTPINFADVIYLKSAEHYVELKTRHRELLFRAKLAVVIEQLNDHDGIQPHRSYWVSRNYVAGVVTRDKKRFLQLSNEELIPVSRHRQDEVDKWVQKHLPSA
jgi:hypothetical protein